jgi:HK97 family phage major capsid protein/HK97 family phage prohead protease
MGVSSYAALSLEADTMTVTTGQKLRNLEGHSFLRAISMAPEQEGDCPHCRTFSFSSEQPVVRWFGTEILMHGAKNANLERLNDGAPLLWNHDMDTVLGVVEQASIRNKRGYCTAHFDEKDPTAISRLDQIDRGILRNVSFRYEILKWEESAKDVGTVRITEWAASEVSIVSIPADPTVGFGRSSESIVWVPQAYQATVPAVVQDRTMDDENKPTPIDTAQYAKQERDRIASIRVLEQKYGNKLGKAANELAERSIEEGAKIEDVRASFAELILNRETAPITAPPKEDLTLGLSRKEEKRYSLLRAIKAHVDKDWSEAGFELEVSRALADKIGAPAKGFYVPINDLGVDMRAAQEMQRALITTGNVGQIVATDLRPEMFIEMLRNKLVVRQAGAKYISGCVGNLDIPRQATSGQAFWVTEGSGPSDTNLTTELVSARPKTVGALSSITRLMMLQSTPDIENLVRSDILAIIALELDRAALNGSGTSGQPRGIMQTVGVNTVAIGTNGGALTMDHLIDMETEIALDNADAGSMAYITNARVVGNLKKLKDTTNNYLWSASTFNGLTPSTPGSINGYPVFRTNQVPGNLTKGTGTNLNGVIFGDYSNLLIFEWGQLDLLPNPYGTGYAAGNIELRALHTTDVQVRRPVYFTVLNDATS